MSTLAHSQAADRGWPRTIHSNSIRIDVYQPQVDHWTSGKLQDRTALAITDNATGESSYGTAWLSARTTVDQDTRLVTLYDIDVQKVTFPSAGPRETEYAKAASEALAEWTPTIALDRLLADMAITQNEQKSNEDNLNSDPPRIFVRDKPAVLILIDGEPVLQKVPGSEFMRVVNTPAMIVLDSRSRRYFLRGDGYWMTAAAVRGPWRRATDAPGSLAALLDATGTSRSGDKRDEAGPEIIVSTEPAELIQISGETQFSPIDGTRLLYVTNTESNVFLSLPEQHYYVLLSGRWFHADTLAGPWEFIAGSSLPMDFSRIPGGHPKSGVLASIPGTPEARDAVVAAQIPQTATVDRKTATFTATYDGEPKFKRIADTELSYSINSPDDIIRFRGKYYAVSNGVWFVADDPLGPWAVCDFVPPEIYSIPPTSPVYHVKYVYVYDSTPDWVYVGYTPGYFGSFIWNGVVVYGTGFYYPYWWGNYYFGWPWTWGFGFNYGYWGGGYFWWPWYPRPWYWGQWHYDHHPHYWSNRILYNRSIATNVSSLVYPARTVYDRWPGSSVISRYPVPFRAPGRIASRSGAPGRPGGTLREGIPRRGVPATPRSGSPRGGARTGVPRAAAPRTGAPRRDLYADRSGQIYSHQNGGWYRNDGRSWTRVEPRMTTPRGPQQRIRPPAGPQMRSRIGELEGSRQARIQGQNRVQTYRGMPPSARITSPPPRMSAPRFGGGSVPRSSAPRSPSSGPRMSAPRGGATRSGPPRGGGVRR
ncbi:MAG: hypothetical protein ACM3SW_13275 [Actinomycetota bacterium]